MRLSPEPWPCTNLLDKQANLAQESFDEARFFPLEPVFAQGEFCAGLAQLVEQLICNQQVAGSSPIASLLFPRRASRPIFSNQLRSMGSDVESAQLF